MPSDPYVSCSVLQSSYGLRDLRGTDEKSQICGPGVFLRSLGIRCHNDRPSGGVAQWLERRPVTPEVVGSSPIILAILCRGSSVGRA